MPRADQCRVGTSVTATPPPSSTRSCQSNASALIAKSALRIVTSLPSGVTTRGAKFCRKPRQRRDIEMIVMTVRDQHDVDLRQLLERDAGIVVPLRSGKADGRDPRGPDGIDEDVEAAGLDQPAGVADEGEPHLVAVDALRRRVGIGIWHPVRPVCALPPAAELPAQHLAERSSAAPRRDRRRAVPSKWSETGPS